MIFKTKNKTILIILAILSIAIVLVGLFWIIRNKRPGLISSFQNSNNEINQPLPEGDDEEKETKTSFNLNSESDVYKIKKDDKWVYVINGQEGAAYDQVENLTFGLDGKRVAYSAVLDGQVYLVIDNISKVVPYKQIVSIVFSPDGNRIAYVADNGEVFVVVIDDKLSKGYKEIGTLGTENGQAYIIFSPNSEKIAYKVVTEEGAFVVVNQQEGRIYDDISDFQFSDDSKQFSYQAESGVHKITVINNLKEIINENAETQYSTSTSNNYNYNKQYTNSGSKGTGETYSGGYNESLFQISCKGSNGVSDCRK